MATKKATKAKPIDGRTTTRSRRAAQVEDGPLYRVTRPSFVDGRLVPKGESVVYYGLPGSALHPLNAEAVKRKKAVQAIRTDSKLSATERQEKLRALSDEYNGVEAEDGDWDDELAGDEPLPDGERRELEKHAEASVKATEEAHKDDTNVVGVKLQGKLRETEASKQGNTPVTDGKAK